MDDKELDDIIIKSAKHAGLWTDDMSKAIRIGGKWRIRVAYLDLPTLKAALHQWGNRQRIKEAEYLLGWFDDNGVPQFDANGLKSRIKELEELSK